MTGGRRLRIALAVHGFFPEQFFGAAVYVRQLADALAALGHEPHVLTAQIASGVDHAILLPVECVDGLPVHRVRRPAAVGVRETYRDERLAQVLHQALARIAPDVVHLAHFLNLTTVLVEVADSRGLPVFATFTDFHGFCHRGTLVDAARRRCTGPDRRRHNCLACGLVDRAGEHPGHLGLAYLASPIARATTATVLPTLRRWLPPSVAADVSAILDRPQVIAADLARLRGAIAPTKFLSERYAAHGFGRSLHHIPFGIAADRGPRGDRSDVPLRIGFIGQLSPHKGCHVLLEALRHLDAEHLEVLVFGDETRNPPYAARLRRLAVGRPVAFMGAISLAEMDRCLRGLDILVVPSLWPENAPLTLLQALACHTPVIVSDQPGMTEFVEDGVNGRVVAAGDPHALAQRLRELARDRTQVARLRAATAYEKTPLAMARETLDVYAMGGVDSC